MNMVGRLIILFILSAYREKVHPGNATSLLNFRVGFLDLDFNFHINNGKIVTLFDLGKLDLLTKCGMIKPQITGEFQSVIKENICTYPRSAGYGQRVEMEGHILRWDEKHIVIRQRLYKKPKVYSGIRSKLFKKTKNTKAEKSLVAEITSTCAFRQGRKVLKPSDAFFKARGIQIEAVGEWSGTHEFIAETAD